MTEIKDTIIEKIQSGEVTMKPRSHFLVRSLFWVVGTLLVATLAVYVLSFVSFILSSSGMLFAPHFGMRGVSFFLISSPWFLLSLTALFLLLLYILITHFSFSYKRPHVYTLLGIVFFMLICSSILHHFAMHDRLQNFAERNNLPGVGPLYRHMGDRPEGVVVGTVMKLHEAGFTLSSEKGEVLTVYTDAATKIPKEPLLGGTVVVVFGERHEDVVQAFGVKPIDKNLERRKGGMRVR